MLKYNTLSLVVLSALLSACGGGGGGGSSDSALTTTQPALSVSAPPVAEQPATPDNPAPEPPTEEQPITPTPPSTEPTSPVIENTTVTPPAEEPIPENLPSDTAPKVEEVSTRTVGTLNSETMAYSNHIRMFVEPTQKDVVELVQRKMKLDDTSNTLSFVSPDITASAVNEAWQRRYEVGLNAVHDQVDGVVNDFGGAIAYFSLPSLDDPGHATAIFLRDPAVAGFRHQTFGYVLDFAMPNEERALEPGLVGFVSIGNAFTPKDDATINASYKGIAVGHIMDDSPWRAAHSQVLADMAAELKFGPEEKTLDLSIKNTKISPENISGLQYKPVEDASYLDFTEKLEWDSQQKVFIDKSDTIDAFANLYGPEAEEVGGTYQLQFYYLDDPDRRNHVYQGGFGGVKKE